jgi:hypothetical protein
VNIADSGEDHIPVAVGEDGAAGKVEYVLRGLPASRTCD